MFRLNGNPGFACPECHGQLYTLEHEHVCKACNRAYPIKGKIHLLTPAKLHESTREDIKAWDDSESGRVEHLEPWRALLHKEPLIRDFEESVLSKFNFAGRFLEIGGGICWASYLVKHVFPECVTYASDVACSALLRAMQLSKVIGLWPDFYLTLDVQSCPFSDDYFDFVFGSAILHHIPDLARGLSEIRRILKPNGYFIAIQEHACSPLLKALIKNTSVGRLGKETEKYQIQERQVSLNEFLRAFKNAGFSRVTYCCCKNPQYKQYRYLYPRIVLAYYLSLSILPDFISLKLLGSEVHIIARK